LKIEDQFLGYVQPYSSLTYWIPS